MSSTEHRVARSTKTDKVYNTIDLYPGPKFAMLELLDDKDSNYFRREVGKKGFTEVTPDAGRNKKTYYWHRPAESDLSAYRDIKPDWFYISGHYARTTWTTETKTLRMLPAGFFNEPFHKKEWKSVFGKTAATSSFLQTETFLGTDEAKFDEEVKKHWHRSPYLPWAKEKDTTGQKKIIDEWLAVWKQPGVEANVHTTTVPAMRGLFCGNTWPDAKVVMLVGCNTLAWTKEGFRKAFPNALVLGYIGKNPADAVPQIKTFLKCAFAGVSGPQDPKLTDHDHLAKAWMDVWQKRRVPYAFRMAYMKPDGKVYTAKRVSGKFETAEVGTSTQIIGRRKGKDKYVTFIPPWRF